MPAAMLQTSGGLALIGLGRRNDTSCPLILQGSAGFMLTIEYDILTHRHFGRCIQLARVGYTERLRAALALYSLEIARIVADRPLERDEAYRLAVRWGLVER